MDKTSYILSKFHKSPNSNGEIHTHCPFHQDNSPSFSIDIETGLFICRSASCGLRGNFPLFYKLSENIRTWKEVHEILKEVTTNYDVADLFTKKAQYVSPLNVTIPFPTEVEPIGLIKYFENRQISHDVINSFGLVFGKCGEFSGVNIGNSVVVPVWDIDGSYKTFQVRYLTEDKKKRWINPVGSPIQHLLYGGWRIVEELKHLWIVEGASDCWKLATYGIQAVGLNTKDASASQLNKIIKLCKYLKLTPVVCLDGDALAYSEKVWNNLTAAGLKTELVKLEYSEDPGELSRERLDQLWSPT